MILFKRAVNTSSSLNPGLRGRYAPPLGAVSSRGNRVSIGKESPLEENDLGGLRRWLRLGC